MKTLKIIGNCCCVFLAIIAILVSLAFVYYHFFVHDLTVGTNYIDNQIGLDIVKADDLTEEQKNEYEGRYFLEANFYSNSKNNGIALQEMKLNYFTDYNLLSTGYRSTGMQYLGDLKQEDLQLVATTEEQANRDEPSGFSYYDTTNGINWDGGKLRTQLNRESCFVISIDGKPYQIQLDKTYEWTTYQRQWYTLWIWNKPTTHVWMYTYLDVFADCMQAIRSNSAGFGDYYITVDLSEYFTIRAFDENTGKYKQDDVTDIIKSYSVLKFHYDENGAKNSTQSMFGCIDCNPNYDVSEDTINTTYWQERMVYTLNEDDFSYRYSDVYEGYFISLTMETKKLFADMPRAKVNINIDLQSDYLSNKEINIVGIDYNGFENFEIDTLTITGKAQTIYLLDKSLSNTKLQTFKYSNGIIFDIAENAINNEYVEVVL
ncbi:MAG: hypothetical protein ACI4L1_00605 [Christensenellales bacterium]